jgi:hypothetical protein
LDARSPGPLVESRATAPLPCRERDAPACTAVEDDAERDAEQHEDRDDDRERRRRPSAHVSVSKRNPTPRTVVIKRGLVGSSPSFLRSDEMCMSRVRVEPK